MPRVLMSPGNEFRDSAATKKGVLPEAGEREKEYGSSDMPEMRQ
jgi:hypothetical protein